MSVLAILWTNPWTFHPVAKLNTVKPHYLELEGIKKKVRGIGVFELCEFQ
jgi:hypothetical protein